MYIKFKKSVQIHILKQKKIKIFFKLKKKHRINLYTSCFTSQQNK